MNPTQNPNFLLGLGQQLGQQGQQQRQNPNRQRGWGSVGPAIQMLLSLGLRYVAEKKQQQGLMSELTKAEKEGKKIKRVWSQDKGWQYTIEEKTDELTKKLYANYLLKQEAQTFWMKEKPSPMNFQEFSDALEGRTVSPDISPTDIPGTEVTGAGVTGAEPKGNMLETISNLFQPRQPGMGVSPSFGLGLPAPAITPTTPPTAIPPPTRPRPAPPTAIPPTAPSRQDIVRTGKINNRRVAELRDGRIIYLDTGEEVK